MAMGIGAAMSYYLDPAHGIDRRRGVGEKVRSLVESRGAAGGTGVEETLLAGTGSGRSSGRIGERPGAHADPTGGAAPVQGAPTLHSADVMG
jgi:hypothetical protein